MREYLLTTDSTADLPEGFLSENNIYSFLIEFTIDGVEYAYDKQTLSLEEFYEEMLRGKTPTTAQVSPQRYMQVFEEKVKAGYDILHLAFSSALSGSCQSAVLAAQQLAAQYPDSKIAVVDSLAASMGQGLFVWQANEYKRQGMDIDGAAKELEKMREHLFQYFTVDDLQYLYRGGRVSKTSAMMGTMLNIKPVLHVDCEGYLKPLYKVRGRKSSLNGLADKFKELAAQSDMFFVSHAHCPEDAQYVADACMSAGIAKAYMTNYIGPAVGSHSGPGTVALFFFSDKNRNDIK